VDDESTDGTSAAAKRFLAGPGILCWLSGTNHVLGAVHSRVRVQPIFNSFRGRLRYRHIDWEGAHTGRQVYTIVHLYPKYLLAI
jgi:hypothetical protein